MLEGWLEFHRATLLAKCEGLDPAQLAARSVPPSTLSLLGLVRHMSEVERIGSPACSWASTSTPLLSREDPDGDFNGAAPDNAAQSFANFAADCDRSREIAARQRPRPGRRAGAYGGAGYAAVDHGAHD